MHGVWLIFDPENIKKISSETNSMFSANLQIQFQTNIIFFIFYSN